MWMNIDLRVDCNFDSCSAGVEFIFIEFEKINAKTDKRNFQNFCKAIIM